MKKLTNLINEGRGTPLKILYSYFRDNLKDTILMVTSVDGNMITVQSKDNINYGLSVNQFKKLVKNGDWVKLKDTKAAEKLFKESVNEAYDIGMARKGNGITVYNRAEEEAGDYKNVAHIDTKGKIKYYDKKLPSKIKKQIEVEAKKMMEIKLEETMKLKDVLNESSVQVGKVYSNPYAKSWVKEADERQSTEEMTEDQRSAFLEAVKGYRTYGESVYRKEGLTKVYESIRNMVEVANKVTLSETGDWFDSVTVGRHMKRMNESFKVFERTLKEVSTLQQRLESSYDEIGEVLGKYYEINELEEGNEFGAARAKAIAAGKSEFEVDGKTYKVTGVDKEDKENAKKFANEGKMKLTDLLNESYGIGELPSSKLKKMKMTLGEIMDESAVNEASRRATDFYGDSKHGKSIHSFLRGKWDSKKVENYLEKLGGGSDVKYARIIDFISGDVGLNIRKYKNIGEQLPDLMKQLEVLYKDFLTEVVNEGASAEEKRIVMMAVRKLAKNRGVSIEMAMNDLLRAADDVDRDIQKGKIKK